MRVLLLCDWMPRFDGVPTGDQQPFLRLRPLAARHDFTIGCVRSVDEPTPSPPVESRIRVETLPAPAAVLSTLAARVPALRSVSATLQLLFDPRPTALAGRGHGRLRAAIAVLVDRVRPDLLHCIGLGMLADAPPVSVPIVADWLDVQSVAQRRAVRALPHRRRLFPLLDTRKLEAAEGRLLRRARLAIAVSRAEGAIVAQRAPGVPVRVIHTSTDVEHFRPANAREDPATVLYAGKLDYEPNVDAAEFLCAHIWPRIRAAAPRTRLLIAGMNPGARVRKLAAADVDVVGTVPDMRSYWERAAVVVVPLRFGSGTRNRIVEAWAMEKAVVSTRVGAEGLLGVDREHYWLADEPEAFAAAVLELLRYPEIRRDLGRRGRSLACEQYSLAAAAEQLDCAYRDASAPH